MTVLVERLALGLALATSLALAGTALADDSPDVTQVVAIDANGNLEMILAQAKSNEAIFKRLGIDATRRYMQASIAGADTGTIAVVIEYDSLEDLAKAQDKLRGDAEWQKYIDKIGAAGVSVESNSIWLNITP